MRVAFLAFSVKGAMLHYLDALVPNLAKHVELHLFVPEHYAGQVGSATEHRFCTGARRSRALLSFINPVAARRVWKEIRNLRPTLLHLFNGEGYPWAPLFARKAHHERIPLLVTLHDPDVHPGNFYEWMNGCIRRFVIPRATSVHVHCRVFIDKARNLGARHVVVIPHGSIAQRFLKYRKKNVSREYAALFFGRIEAYKGLDLLVEAGLRLRGKMKVIIAGPGHIPIKIKRLLVRHSECFELHNRYITDEEVAELFQRVSVLVLPYRQATQSSLPLIAAAFGVPTVATSVGGLTEDVARVRGILVPPGDPTALADAIQNAVGITPEYPIELEMHNIAVKFTEWYADVVG